MVTVLTVWFFLKFIMMVIFTVFTINIIHEMGHYLCARFFKLEVERVTLGKGFCLFKTTIQGCEFVLNANFIHAGVTGLKGETDNFNDLEINITQKILLICAGISANIIGLIIALIFIWKGRLYLDAYKAFAQPGVSIFETMNNVPIVFYYIIAVIISQPIDLTLGGDGKELRRILKNKK